MSQKGIVCKIYTEFVQFSRKTNNLPQQIATPKKINRLKVTLKHAWCYWSKLGPMKILTRDATRRTEVKKYGPYPSVNVNLECGSRTLHYHWICKTLHTCKTAMAVRYPLIFPINFTYSLAYVVTLKNCLFLKNMYCTASPILCGSWLKRNESICPHKATSNNICSSWNRLMYK